MREVNKLAHAIRFALLASTIAIPATSFAANEKAKEKTNKIAIQAQAKATNKASDLEEEVEEVVERIAVTGSRIKRSEFSNASPIQVVNRPVFARDSIT